MKTTLASLKLIEGRMEASLGTVERRPDVALAIKNYRARIENIKSMDEFIGDDRVFRFAMKAFGLQDFTFAKAFMRKVLTEGIDSPSAFANQMVDGRYREFAETFNFQRYGEAATIFDRARQGTIDRYIRQELEETAGATNESTRLALYFQRKAGAISRPIDILADKALTKVVFTALGIPALVSIQSIDKQIALLESKLDLSTFRTPEGISRFTARFAARADADAQVQATSVATPLSTAAVGLSVDVMLAAQSVRLARSR